MLVSPEAYTVLALVIHEMMTNSAKYGALSDSTGHVRIDLEKAESGDLEMFWNETGGPPVRPPSRRGFGSTIIERSIPFELEGEASIDYKLKGVEARFCIPARFVTWKDRAEPKAAKAAKQGVKDLEAGALPKSLLLVEDSMIIALDTEDCLREIGLEKVQVESSVAGALDTLKSNTPDLVLLDYNLGKESSERVALALKEKGIPFWLATGYGEMEDRLEELGACGLLTKPYGRDELVKMLGEYAKLD